MHPAATFPTRPDHATPSFLLRVRATLAVIASVLALAACGGSDNAAAPAKAYVGKVEGTDALIGLVSDGVAAIAYVCDGQELATWFRGAQADARTIQLDSGGDGLVANVSEQSAEGHVVLAGTRRKFTAVPAAPGTTAGLYRADVPLDAGTLIGGWIALASGEVRGLLKLGSTTLSTSQLSLASGSVLVTSSILTDTVVLAAVSTSTTTCAYSGTVKSASGASLSGVRVRVYDITTTPNRLIGEATTGATGAYRFTATQNSPAPTRTFRAVATDSAGRTVGQASTSASCGAVLNIVGS